MVFFDPVEALKDEGEIVTGDADSVIDDGNGGRAVFLFPGPNFYSDGGIGVLLERVLYQVKEELGPVEEVPGDREPIDVCFNSGVLVFDDQVKPFDNVMNAVGEFKLFDFERSRVVGLQLGNNEHVFNDAQARPHPIF